MKLISDFGYDTTLQKRGVLSMDLVVDLEKGHTGTREFYDKSGNLIATAIGDILTIFKGFSCDLCSPAWRVGRWWIGTWTTRREALGAFLHDFARSCLGNEHTLWKTLKATDDLFWDGLGVMESNVQRTYHWVVSSFLGKAFYHLTFHGPTTRVVLIT